METLDELNAILLNCRLCPRLVAWREQVAHEKRKAYQDQVYWGKPVPGFGDPTGRVMVVGLAPGAHGSNRTGRMFTGDASGNFLFSALHQAGFANQPTSVSRDDGLTLSDIYITAVARCAPPDNKPLPSELANCQPYLQTELRLIRPHVIVALGRIAFDGLLRIFSLDAEGRRQPPAAKMDFAHGALFDLCPADASLSPAKLLCSYHPSRQNTQTGRLTPDMFASIWATARALLIE